MNLSHKLITTTIFWLTMILSYSQKIFGQSTEVKTLYFETNSCLIDSKYIPTLDDIGQKCTSVTFSSLKIFAYADTQGTKQYNEHLSEKRALAVYNYLTQKFHIDTTKIYVTWLGEETNGAYDLHFPSAKVQQRCVDILLSFKKR